MTETEEDFDETEDHGDGNLPAELEDREEDTPPEDEVDLPDRGE